MNYLIGIDIGTSATKTILADENGNIVSEASYEYEMYQPRNGWAEQNPDDWKQAVLSTMKEVIKGANISSEKIKGIGLSGQMHGLVMLDENGSPIRNSIIWCDQRTEKQVGDMLQIMPREKWMEITANPPIAAWTAAKILWVKEWEPDNYKRCRHILLPKDYIRYVLTGEYATDVSDATGTQLLDVKNRCWSNTVLEALDINEDLLCKVYESQENTGFVLPEIAKECALGSDVVVAAGASDNACAAIGTGVVEHGEALASIGTSAIIYTHLDHYMQIPNGSLHVCCSAVPGCWHTMGGPQAAGLSLQWFLNNFCHEYRNIAAKEGIEYMDLINGEIEGVPAGSDKLIYLPFLMGERTPHMEPNCRGAFIGLNAVHTKANMLRAVMEGVGYSMADCNEILKKVGVSISSLKICGGGSKSNIWRQIISDLCECDIQTMEKDEGPAFGAVILAGVAAGIYSDVKTACRKYLKIKHTTNCNQENIKIYRRYHALYKKIYNNLKENFIELSNM